MLFLRYVACFSAVLLSFASFVAARPGMVDESRSLFRRTSTPPKCPDTGHDNDYTKCLDISFSTLKGRTSQSHQSALHSMAGGDKIDFWICYNKKTETIWIDNKIYTGQKWMIDIIIAIQLTLQPSSCKCDSPWTPPSFGKKGKDQCTPPPNQCAYGYTLCNGCCQSSKYCATYKPPSPPSHPKRQVCKAGQTECYLGSGLYDCIDVNADVESCGGCLFRSPESDHKASFTSGQDCTEIPNVSAVQCQKGRCVVEKCTFSHKLDRANNSCVPLTMGGLKMQKYRLPGSA